MIAEVIVDLTNSNVDKVFDYTFNEEHNIEVGSQVLVPFGGRKIEGYVISIKDKSSYDKAKLKSIIKTLNAQPVLNYHLVQLSFFMKRKFHLRLADTIRLFLPPQVRSGMKTKVQNDVFLNENFDISTLKSNAVKQIGVINFLKENPSANIISLNKQFSSESVKKLISIGALNVVSKEVYNIVKSEFTVEHKKIELTAQQKEVINAINSLKTGTFLLHGVTGSGKTEVYFNCIKSVLDAGKTAIMLVPEISLTPQMLARFRNKFGDKVAILHSMLTPRERFDEWNRLKIGTAKIALGARSCVFAPLEKIGVIIIDEEHDQSYFSENNPRYHTHEVAKFLAKEYNCPLILGSATPSIESYYNAKTGNYKLLELPNRPNNRELPKVQIVDMLSEIRNGNSGVFSTVLLEEIKKCIDDNKQAMIFINRRGYSSFVMCRECGYVPKCDDCDVSLVYHKEDGMLKCHYCNKRYKALTNCPGCGSESIRFGAVGTQKIVEELQETFKGVKILRLDNDTNVDGQTYVKILEEFNHTTPAILVGTQMIAKGHDFNNVTLVGVVDADLSLHFNDFRATERTFQLITQVAGRAGRSVHEGKVVLQTYFPKHYVYRCVANYDYLRFYEKEIGLRESTHYPPFTRILRVLVSGEDEAKTTDVLKDVFDKIKTIKSEHSNEFLYLQAMKCPKKRVQRKYRYQVLTRFFAKNEEILLQKTFDSITNNYKDVTVFIEINPQNLS